MTTATQIADWLVNHRAEAGVPIDPMSLEKHLFYAQAFYLATTRRALFQDEFQAWVNGPVVREVWDRYHGPAVIDAPESIPPTLGAEEAKFMRGIVAFCGPLQPMELSLATHAEAPWINAREGFDSWEPCSRVIPQNEIREYYATLIDNGEDALSAHGLLDAVPEPRWAWLYVAGIYSNRMTGHPFYVEGARIWNEKLWERPEVSRDNQKRRFRAPAFDDEKSPITSLEELRREIATH